MVLSIPPVQLSPFTLLYTSSMGLHRTEQPTSIVPNQHTDSHRESGLTVSWCPFKNHQGQDPLLPSDSKSIRVYVIYIRVHIHTPAVTEAESATRGRVSGDMDSRVCGSQAQAPLLAKQYTFGAYITFCF